MALTIGDLPIGPSHPPVVVAEIGLNHAGSMKVALEMICEASKAGAHIVKVQTHCDDEFSDVPAYPGNAGGESIQDFVRRCSLGESEERTLFDYAKAIGIACISTPFSPAAVERLERIGVPAYKAGSGQLRDLPLLRMLAKAGKPVILSTGMGTWRLIGDAVEALRDVPVALLECTSEYPTPHSHVRLDAMRVLRNFAKVVGLSSHTGDIWPSLGAVALGASIVEVHFKIDDCPPGPDLAVSVGPRRLADLVTGARAIWEASGGTKEILPGEAQTLGWFQASRRTA